MEKITLIIPCYNEQESLPFLEKELKKVMNYMNYVKFEIILVDNCSHDNTLSIMKKMCKDDKRYQYISFSRNFGKDASMYAGLQASTGDYVAILDADLQDPPELLIEMYKTLKEEDYDCVAAYRDNREGEPWLRSVLAKAFYKIMGKISKLDMISGARDFRLMKRQMVDSVLLLKESERFTKGIFSWVGFKTKWIAYKNKERVAGKTKLPMKNAFVYALKGITSFSTVPLVFASIMGIIFCVIAVGYMIYVFLNHLISGASIAPGYSSLMCVVLFGFGLVLLVLGIIGQYISQIYTEIKRRPQYIIKECSKEINITK